MLTALLNAHRKLQTAHIKRQTVLCKHQTALSKRQTAQTTVNAHSECLGEPQVKNDVPEIHK